MAPDPTPLDLLYQALRQRYGSSLDQYRLPPPSFTSMQGEILEFNEQAGTLSTRFPVLETQLNPYHMLQGGFIAAAVDNTLGPLSMLVAPPNVTRKLALTYSRPAGLETGWITVKARLEARSDRLLELSADVLDPQGKRLARAKATHWIIAAEP